MGAHVTNVKVCENLTSFTFYGDFSSDAEFFVATGVLSMLWAMVTIPVYLFMDQSYRLDKRYKFAVQYPNALAKTIQKCVLTFL
jgi:hypothetical protein